MTSPCQTKSHLSAVDVIQHEVEFIRRLEAVVQADEERMLDVLDEHVALRHDVLRFVFAHDMRLVEHFDGVHRPLVFVTR